VPTQIFPSSLLLITLLLKPLIGNGQANTSPTASLNQWHHKPTHISSLPDNELARKRWLLRGNSIDRESGAAYALDDPIAANAVGSSSKKGGSAEDRYFLTNPIPVKESDAIVVGTFADHSVLLSQSKRSLYTVIRFTVEATLKSKPLPIMPGEALECVVPGGVAEINGRIIQQRVQSGDDTPLEEHGRYLLFLKYDADRESYSIVKHWLLENGRAVAVDLIETQRVKKGNSDYDGQPENKIIDATKAAVLTETGVR
jgi:hypothetical protein